MNWTTQNKKSSFKNSTDEKNKCKLLNFIAKSKINYTHQSESHKLENSIYTTQIEFPRLNPRKPLSTLDNRTIHSMIRITSMQSINQKQYMSTYTDTEIDTDTQYSLTKIDTMTYPFWAMWIAMTPLINFHQIFISALVYHPNQKNNSPNKIFGKNSPTLI